MQAGCALIFCLGSGRGLNLKMAKSALRNPPNPTRNLPWQRFEAPSCQAKCY